MINLRITESEKTELEAIAERTGIRPSTLIRRALVNVLDLLGEKTEPTAGKQAEPRSDRNEK